MHYGMDALIGQEAVPFGATTASAACAEQSRQFCLHGVLGPARPPMARSYTYSCSCNASLSAQHVGWITRGSKRPRIIYPSYREKRQWLGYERES
jgi:hypothetical protein